MESSPDDDRGDVPTQLELYGIGVDAIAAWASSGWWCVAHASSIALSIAARQIMVQRR